MNGDGQGSDNQSPSEDQKQALLKYLRGNTKNAEKLGAEKIVLKRKTTQTKRKPPKQ